MQKTIYWPENFVPGYADNYASNEVIFRGLSASDLWPYLVMPAFWSLYYDNMQNVCFYDKADFQNPLKINKDSKEILSFGQLFSFETFGFMMRNQVLEFSEPLVDEPTKEARLAWKSWQGEGEDRFEVHHAWLIENLEGGRVRLLTQETQNGKAARDLAKQRPNPMIAGHQEWLEGLRDFALAHS